MNWYLKYPYETILVRKFNVSYFFVCFADQRWSLRERVGYRRLLVE